MKWMTFKVQGEERFGIRISEGIMDVASALNVFPESGLPVSIHEAIAQGPSVVEKLEQYIAKLLSEDVGDRSKYLLAEANVEYGPCVPHPGKIICVGLNYKKHAEETNSPVPKFPILFNKFSNAIIGNGHDVPLPPVSEKVDYEAELGIVIGTRAKYVTREEALSYVVGYCNVNDLSARDLQMRTQQWLLGKSLDSFAPVGPYLVTSDEVGNPNELQISCTVNGEIRQQSNTSDMIFRCDEIVSYISQFMTLEPGDIILTGTPEGVVMGYPPEKQVYLKDGDVVTVEIEKLGSLTNRMVAE
jgi:2-keto-4-pentenoate hydratase/2-oxohepta-3-ene-1,7-dioic acid hydratase in catechol pathway